MDHTPIVESCTGSPEPASWSRTLVWADEAATAAFAHELAQRSDVRDAVVSLRGDLGAGKTTLVRHLLRALGISGRIKSPTYAVVEPYSLAAGPDQPALQAWHFDFYRFSDPREWEDAGFRDLFAGPGLKLCEWPEHAAGLMPVADLDVTLTVHNDDQRRVQLQAHTPRGARLLPPP